MNNDFIQRMADARQSTQSFTIDLKEIKILNKTQIEVGGKTIPISHQAFKDLIQIAGITNALLMHLNETLNPNAGFLLIKELMKAISAKKNGSKVSMIIDTALQEVIRITFDVSQNTIAVSPGAIEEFLTSLTKTNNISLTDTLITDSGTKVTFNIKWDVTIPLKMPGETISYGKQISWDMFGDVQAEDLIERLVCTNGMTRILPSNKPIMLNAQSTPSDWYNTLYHDMSNPNKKVIDHYESKMLTAMQTGLSVYEYNKIKGYALSIWKDDVEKIIRHIGDDRMWKVEYESKGIDLEKLSAGQLRNCPTPVNAADAINMLTDLASHTYSTVVSASSKKRTQKLAGQILNSTWDEDTHITNVPKFNKVSKLKI